MDASLIEVKAPTHTMVEGSEGKAAWATTLQQRDLNPFLGAPACNMEMVTPAQPTSHFVRGQTHPCTHRQGSHSSPGMCCMNH